MKYALPLMFVALAVAACAGQPVPDTSGRARMARSDQVCVVAPITGSHVIRNICMDKDAYRERERKAQDVMVRATMGRPRPKLGDDGNG